jgi:hypothetical protein
MNVVLGFLVVLLGMIFHVRRCGFKTCYVGLFELVSNEAGVCCISVASDCYERRVEIVPDCQELDLIPLSSLSSTPSDLVV